MPARAGRRAGRIGEKPLNTGANSVGTAVAPSSVVDVDLDHAAPAQASRVKLRVVGPDAACLSPTDLGRLFRGRSLTPARRARILNGGRVLAACGTRVVGLAGYERSDGELRVHEFAVDATAPCPADEIATALLDALEMACLAGGGRRLVLLPRAASAGDLLRARGFVPIAGDSAGSWFEKLFAP
jgi:hypothetical protein